MSCFLRSKVIWQISINWRVFLLSILIIRRGQQRLTPLVVRAHFRNFWLGKAFFNKIWHAVVLTQFGNADSKSAPCQAIFCFFPTQNSKTKWPPKLVKMSQLYITAWLTMNIKTSFRCIKTHLSNIPKVPWISPCALFPTVLSWFDLAVTLKWPYHDLGITLGFDRVIGSAGPIIYFQPFWADLTLLWSIDDLNKTLG